MRATGHEGLVLGTRGLALGAIDDDHGPSVGALGDAAPLASDGEPGPAAAEEAARLQDGDQVACLGGRQATEAALMVH